MNAKAEAEQNLAVSAVSLKSSVRYSLGSYCCWAIWAEDQIFIKPATKVVSDRAALGFSSNRIRGRCLSR